MKNKFVENSISLTPYIYRSVFLCANTQTTHQAAVLINIFVIEYMQQTVLLLVFFLLLLLFASITIIIVTIIIVLDRVFFYNWLHYSPLDYRV